MRSTYDLTARCRVVSCDCHCPIDPKTKQNATELSLERFVCFVSYYYFFHATTLYPLEVETEISYIKSCD